MRSLALALNGLFLMTLASSLAAQIPTIRLHYGYYVPRMQSVNDQIETQVNRWSEIIGESIAQPGKINGDRAFGMQLQYPMNADNALSLDISYYGETVAVEHFSTVALSLNRFFFERDVKLFSVVLNLHHYFDYSTRHRLNYYLGFGVGANFAKAKSATDLTFTVNSMTGGAIDPVSTRGDFSGSALSLALSAGFDFRIFRSASLWGEVRLQYAKIGQLTGNVTTIANPAGGDTSSDSSFDFTGAGARGGIAIDLPFLQKD